MLLKQSEGRSADVYDEAILLSARLEKHLKNKRLGLTDSDQEMRNIEYSILQLSEQIHVSDITGGYVKATAPQKKRLRLLIGGLILILVVAGFYIFLSGRNKMPEETAAFQQAPEQWENAGPQPDIKPEQEKSKSPGTANMPPRDRAANNKFEKPGQQPENDNTVVLKKDSIQLPLPFEKTPPKIEYINFKLVVNASNEQDSIFIDGELANILGGSTLTVKIIRLQKSDQPHNIQIRRGEKSCEKNHLIIMDNQKITMPCSF